MKPENMTILTVDDTPANVRLLTHYLEKQGYRVLTAEDGFEGFKAAVQYHPDLVLLDVMMPGTDGYEVCELLKAEEETKDIPVVFLTAKADVEDRVRGFELGAVDYITKPFNLVEIAARVKNQLLLKYYEKLSMRTQKAMLQTQRATSLGKISETISSRLASDIEQLKKEKGTSDGSPSMKRLSGTIEKWQAFLDLSRYENESIKINELIQDVSELIQSATRNKVQFEIEKPPEAIAVFGNYGLIHQTFLDIFLNAGESGTKIHVRLSEEPLPENLHSELKSEPAERYIKVELEDAGHKKDELTYDPESGLYFNPKKINDLGLRLSAAQKIIQDHLGLLKYHASEKYPNFLQIYLPSFK